MAEPVFVFRDEYQPDDYWTDAYLLGALPVLRRLGWLTRPLALADEAAAVKALEGLYDLDLDATDVFPFGLLWALRSTGAIGDVPGLDAQLTGWREWEETDHVGEPLAFLSPLAAQHRTEES
jgi:hypothetical protein